MKDKQKTDKIQVFSLLVTASLVCWFLVSEPWERERTYETAGVLPVCATKEAYKDIRTALLHGHSKLYQELMKSECAIFEKGIPVKFLDGEFMGAKKILIMLGDGYETEGWTGDKNVIEIS